MKRFKSFSKRKKTFLIICFFISAFCLYKGIAYEFLSIEDKIADRIDFSAFSSDEEISQFHLMDEVSEDNYFVIAETNSGMLVFGYLNIQKGFLCTTDVSLLGRVLLSEDNLNDLGNGLYYENIMALNNNDESCYVGVIKHDPNNQVINNGNVLKLNEIKLLSGITYDIWYLISLDDVIVNVNGKAIL